MRLVDAMLAAALCLGSAAAVANESGLYFDVNLGQSTANDLKKRDFDVLASFPLGSINASKLDDSGSFWSAAVGFKPFSYFSAEIGWADLGDAKYVASNSTLQYKARVSSSGPLIAANGLLPLGKRFELQGHAGIFLAKTSVTQYVTDFSNSAVFSQEAKTKEYFYGVGAAFNVTDTISTHLGVTRFNKVGDKNVTSESNVDVISLGVSFSQ